MRIEQIWTLVAQARPPSPRCSDVRVIRHSSAARSSRTLSPLPRPPTSPMRRLLFILTILALAGPAATAAHANVDTQEVLWLDMHQPGRNHPAGPVTTSGPLSSSRYYVAIVTGTISAFDVSRWGDGTPC